jgi:hypothetical protein
MGYQATDASYWEAESAKGMWGRSGQVNMEPFQKVSSKFFGLGKGWRTFLWARAQNAYNFRRNPFACGILSFLAPYFWLFQPFLRVPDRYEPWEAARLVRPLIPALLADTHKMTFLDIDELISPETSAGIQQSTVTSQKLRVFNNASYRSSNPPFYFFFY